MSDTMLTEKKTTEKPLGILGSALKMVKGENTAQLMENFTAEMTLVAEGLCEDQSRLHRDVERMVTEQDQRVQRLESSLELMETSLDEERSARDRDLTEMRQRLAVLERQAGKAQVREKEKEKKRGNIIKDLTVLVAIAAGAWVIVTIINKFF